MFSLAFERPLKLFIEIETSRTVVGSEFHVSGADAGKLRFPYLVVLHRSATRLKILVSGRAKTASRGTR